LGASSVENFWVSFGLLLATLPAFDQQHQKPLVTFESPTACRGAYGFWRWAAKTDTASPPDTIAPDHHIKPSDIAEGKIPTGKSSGILRASVARRNGLLSRAGSPMGRPNEDGDLHIELRDADNPHGVRVVVEVPLDHHGGMTPWTGSHNGYEAVPAQRPVA
jgi:hypothetical protein